MRKIVVSIIVVMMTLAMMAVPAKKVKRTFTLADGTCVEAVFMGDENIHFYQSEDGRRFQIGDGGIAVEIPAGQISEQWSARLNASNEARARRFAESSKASKAGKSFTGKQKGLVLLVEFPDKKFTHTRAEYDDFFNKSGYKENGQYGSVHDYFYDNSCGAFDLSFDVVGPIEVSQPFGYYGKNDGNGKDLYPAAMVKEAALLADSIVDFSKYDWNGDYYVNQVVVIYAGYGEAQHNELTQSIWPHEGYLSIGRYPAGLPEGRMMLDGVYLDTYACSSELCGSQGTDMDGVGTACHEFAHCMGLPDMYDTSGGVNYGMTAWDIMDYGNYNGPKDRSECPAGFTSYERWYCGWLEPTELDKPCRVSSLQPLAQNPEAYIIRSSGNADEYYMLENRQLVGWDSWLYGHGMLILHVDYESGAWNRNMVNSIPLHQRMTVIPADNDVTVSPAGLAGDTWPGTSGNTALTDTSKPAATLYTFNKDGERLMSRPVTDIRESEDGIISFTFDGGFERETPVITGFAESASDEYILTWTPVVNADGYQIQLQGQTVVSNLSEALLLEEDFSKFCTGEMDGTSDLKNSLNDYTTVPGWTGSRVYTSPEKGARLGTMIYTGKLYTPVVHPKEDNVTIVLGCIRCGNDVGVVEVTTPSFLPTSVTPESELRYHYIQVPSTEKFMVQLATSVRRAYIKYLAIYDGKFTQEEIEKSRETTARQRAANQTLIEVSTNSYTFTDLPGNVSYTARVRSVYGDLFSEWSEPVQFNVKNGISDVTVARHSGKMFNLSGQRVDGSYRGIIIRDNKKVVGNR